MGSAKGLPKAPNYLSKETKLWWGAVVRKYVLESHHLRLLQIACESWDQAAKARAVLATGGFTTLDRFGQSVVRPEIKIAHDSRVLFTRVIRELNLPTDTAPAAPEEE